MDDLTSILDFGSEVATLHQPAVDHPLRSFTYGELDREVESLRSTITSVGLSPGDRVAIFIDDDPHWVAAVIAAWREGAVILALDWANWQETKELMRRAAPRWAIVRRERVQHLRYVQKRDLNEHLVVERLDVEETATLHSDVAYLAPTSASTGSAKIVLGSRRGLATFIAAELDLMGAAHRWRVARLTLPTFDVFWRDLLLPLAARGTLCLMPRMEQRLHPVALAKWLDDRHIEVVHCVPTVLRALGKQLPGHRPSSLRWLMVAGEPLFAADVRPWLETTDTTVVNVYGTTETTLAKFFHVVRREDLDRDPIPVGKCIPGAAAIVLDEHLQPCPPGKSGEIFIATRHPLHGYLDDTERSRQRFVPNPVGGSGALVDRTGDVGRVRIDGVLEVVGRMDDTVKVAGMRVGLSAIEGRLRSHPGVEDCHVTFSRGADHEGYVAAFVSPLPASAAAAGELRRWLRSGGVVAASVPMRFQFVESIPRSARGKVDRHELARALAADEPRHIAPMSETEALLHQLWREVLPSAGTFGIDDEFEALGGQSIHAAQVVARLELATGVRCSLGEFLTRNTIDGFSEYVDARLLEARVDASSPVVHHGQEGRFAELADREQMPLSFAQRRFWRMQLQPDAPALHYLWLGSIDGPLDMARMRRAIHDTANRQSATRTLFIARDDHTEPVARVAHAERVELQSLQSSGQGLSADVQLVREWALRRFELGREPPLRVAVVEQHPERRLLALAGHVIVSDGMSKSLLLSDLSDAYAQRVPGSLLQHGFEHYASWERSPAALELFEPRLEYWRSRLPVRLAPPRLPYRNDVDVRPRGADPVTVRFSVPTSRSLRAVARSHAMSETSVILAVLALALQDWTGEPAVPVLVPNHNRLYREEQMIAGCWTETAAIVLPPADDIHEMLAAARDAIGGLFDNAVPFDWLLDRLFPGQDTCAPELFPVMFAPQPDLHGSLRLQGCGVRKIASTADLRQAIFPLHVLSDGGGEEELEITLVYDTARLGERAIHELADGIEGWVGRLAAKPLDRATMRPSEARA